MAHRDCEECEYFRTQYQQWFKVNVHVSELARQVSTRLYFIRQLNKSHVAKRELLLLYITCIRSTLEYGSPLFHRDLPSYLYEDLERLQKRAMKIIYPELSYAKALELSWLLTLYHRREAIAAKSFDEIGANQSHSLKKLLPSKYQPSYSLREQRHLFVQSVKLKSSKSSFLLSYVYSSWELDKMLSLCVYRNLTHAFEFVLL